MNKQTYIILGVIGIIALGGIIWWITAGSPGSQETSSFPQDAQNAPTTTQPNTAPPEQQAPPPAPEANIHANTTIVTYTDGGFTPQTVTVQKGSTVVFKNSSSRKMWVASDPHPTHEGYSGTTRTQHCPDTTQTAFDQCSVGDTYSFTFEKAGSWGYHNHDLPTETGTIVVQ